jgi:hypothetical protein
MNLGQLLWGPFDCLDPPRTPLTVNVMKSILKRLLGGRRSFRDLFVGETVAPDLSGECGGGKLARHREPGGTPL